MPSISALSSVRLRSDSQPGPLGRSLAAVHELVAGAQAHLGRLVSEQQRWTGLLEKAVERGDGPGSYRIERTLGRLGAQVHDAAEEVRRLQELQAAVPSSRSIISQGVL